jgi:hypothetical protein
MMGYIPVQVLRWVSLMLTLEVFSLLLELDLMSVHLLLLVEHLVLLLCLLDLFPGFTLAGDDALLGAGVAVGAVLQVCRVSFERRLDMADDGLDLRHRGCLVVRRAACDGAAQFMVPSPTLN